MNEWWESWLWALRPRDSNDVWRALGTWIAAAVTLLIITACIVGVAWLMDQPV